MGDGQNEMAGNRSMLKDFIASIATVGGDLSNITAPPFVLDSKSTVELPAFWAENPSIFCAPAQSNDPATRALRVLKWFLCSLRNQNYMGHSEQHGVKKPLNAFLGEIFVGRWEDEMGTTRLVSEQVSHHPPITACRVWNSEHGVSASGYTRQTITFSGSVTIKQTGHALFTLSKHGESYLIPLPELKVKGVLTGAPYPELGGKYYIASTNGYMSVINFSGKSWFGTGSKHAFEAKLYHENQGEDHPLYLLKGTWNDGFVIYDAKMDKEIEHIDIRIQSQNATELIVEPTDKQDPWETRRAWKVVIDALHNGDMKGVVDAKSVLEKGQRQMRKDEQADDTIWQQTFFTSQPEDSIADALMQKVPNSTIDIEAERKDTKGVWVFDESKWNKGIEKPYHGELVPDNSHRPVEVSSARSSTDSRRDSNASSIGGWMWSFGSRRSSVSAQGAVSTPGSRKGSIDAGRRSLDAGRKSIDNSMLGSVGFSSRDSTSSTSQDRRLSKHLSPLSSVSTSMDVDEAKPGNNDKNQNQIQPQPQTHQSDPTNIPEINVNGTSLPQNSQPSQPSDGDVSSGIAELTMNEKTAVEEHLRDVYSSSTPVSKQRVDAV